MTIDNCAEGFNTHNIPLLVLLCTHVLPESIHHIYFLLLYIIRQVRNPQWLWDESCSYYCHDKGTRFAHICPLNLISTTLSIFYTLHPFKNPKRLWVDLFSFQFFAMVNTTAIPHYLSIFPLNLTTNSFSSLLYIMLPFRDQQLLISHFFIAPTIYIYFFFLHQMHCFLTLFFCRFSDPQWLWQDLFILLLPYFYYRDKMLHSSFAVVFISISVLHLVKVYWAVRVAFPVGGYESRYIIFLRSLIVFTEVSLWR